MFDGVMSPSDSQEESQREAGGSRGEGPGQPCPVQETSADCRN